MRTITWCQNITDLEAEWELVDPRGESSNLAVGQNARVVGVDLVEHLGDVELLLRAHQEVEVGEGELHVLGVTHAVGGRLVELLWESEGKRTEPIKPIPSPAVPEKLDTATCAATAHMSCSSCMMSRSIMCGMWAGTLREVKPNWPLSSLLT